MLWAWWAVGALKTSLAHPEPCQEESGLECPQMSPAGRRACPTLTPTYQSPSRCTGGGLLAAPAAVERCENSLGLQNKPAPRTALVTWGNSLFFVPKEVGGRSLGVREGCVCLSSWKIAEKCRVAWGYSGALRGGCGRQVEDALRAPLALGSMGQRPGWAQTASCLVA